MKTSSVRSAIVLAGLIGLVVSAFAAAEFFEASLRSVCSVNSFFSCAAVDQSGKTSTLGIPDYLWGIGGFVAILVVAGIAERRPKDARPVGLLLALTSAGVALSLYFLYVELAQVHALCIVCATAYVFGVIAWAGAIALAVRARAGSAAEEPRAADAEP